MPKTRWCPSRRAVALCLAVAGLVLCTAAPVHAQATFTWSTTAGTWQQSVSWIPAAVPGANDIAQFTGNSGGDVTQQQNTSIGAIVFNDTNGGSSYFIRNIGVPGNNSFTINGATVGGVPGIGISSTSQFPQEIGTGASVILGSSQTWALGTAAANFGDFQIDIPVNAQFNSITKSAGRGTLTFTGNSVINNLNTLTLNGGLTVFDNPGPPTVSQGTILINSGGTLQLGGALQINSNAIGTVSGPSIIVNAGGILTNQPGTQHNLFALTLNGGTLTTGSADPVNYTMNQGVVVPAGATTTANITANGIVLNGANTFDVANSVSAANPNLADLAVGSPTVPTVLDGGAANGSMFKTGAGVVRLFGPNTITGGVTIGQGTVQLTSTGRTGTGLVTVNGTGTLAGNGIVGGGIAANSGSIVAPTDPARPVQSIPGATNVPAPGQLSLANNTNATFASGSTFKVSIGGDTDTNTDRSQLNVGGTGQLIFPNSGTGTWTVDVSKYSNYTPTNTPHTYTIAVAGGGIPSTGLNTPVSLTTTGTGTQSASNLTTTLQVSGFSAGSQFTLAKSGNTLLLTFNPVPEPVAVLAVLAGGLGFAAWRRRGARQPASLTA